MLASSLFNSIEGIESSHCINTDVEIGGIGVGFAVQDDQEAQNDQDAQGNQDAQNDELSSAVGSRTVILGAGVSPRRTRSGKIVKYRGD